MCTGVVLCTGRIFRSASPTNANEQDIYVLREVLGVKHLVRSTPHLCEAVI